MRQMEPSTGQICTVGACNLEPCNCFRPPKYKKTWPGNFSVSGSNTKPESAAQADQAINNALEEYETISINHNIEPEKLDQDFPSLPVFHFGDFEIQALFYGGPNPFVSLPSESSHWGFHLTCKNCKSVWHIETGVSWSNYLPNAHVQWGVRFQNLLDRIASIKPKNTLDAIVNRGRMRY